MAQDPTPNDIELEIGAFMGPHIKRARIVLVLVGVFYAVIGYRAFGDVAHMRDIVRQLTDGGVHGPDLDQLQHAVSVAYAVVVFVTAAGVANIVLAAIAGQKTMIAFYAAAAIYIAMTGLQLYAGAGTIFTDPVWYLTTICLGLGFQAALKAERLRKRARAGA